MNLLLWRHADAEDGYPDLERALTARGHEQARRVAAWLEPRLPADCLVLCSPARRAVQTAQALARPHRIVPSLAPDTTVKPYLQAIDWPVGPMDSMGPNTAPGAQATVLVVGHQPTLGRLASLLLTGNEIDWPVDKAAVWWLSHGGRGYAGPPSLRAVVDPGLLAP